MEEAGQRRGPPVTFIIFPRYLGNSTAPAAERRLPNRAHTQRDGTQMTHCHMVMSSHHAHETPETHFNTVNNKE